MHLHIRAALVEVQLLAVSAGRKSRRPAWPHLLCGCQPVSRCRVHLWCFYCYCYYCEFFFDIWPTVCSCPTLNVPSGWWLMKSWLLVPCVVKRVGSIVLQKLLGFEGTIFKVTIIFFCNFNFRIQFFKSTKGIFRAPNFIKGVYIYIYFKGTKFY